MAELWDRIGKLRALAADAAATPNERRMAAAVASRLEARAQAERRCAGREDPVFDSRGRVRRAAGQPHIPSTEGSPIDAPWPLAWAGPRARVEFEAALNGDEYVLNWDCPSCGHIVAKAVPLRYIYRLVGAKADPLEAIRGVMDGRANQLCAECTRKHGG